MNNDQQQLVERQVKVIAKAKPLDKQELLDQAKLIRDVLMAVMQPGIHYDVIPGTDKPSLMKAGAEMILLTFRIGLHIEIKDGSDRENNLVAYQIIVTGIHQPTEIVLGQGVGSCSTDEEKYKWRSVVCDEEWDATPQTQRRTKFGKKRDGGHWSSNQIRTNAGDLDNTVLKMAKKRAMVDLALTCTAASQFFGQDVEDLPEELRAMYGNEFSKMREKSSSNGSQTRTSSGNSDKPATDGQIKLLRGKMKSHNKEESELCKEFGIEKLEVLTMGKVNDAIAWVTQ